MPLTDDIEQLELEALLGNSESGSTRAADYLSSALKLLDTLDLITLAQICKENPAILRHLQQPHFEKFWEVKLTGLKLPHDAEFQFHPQPKIKNIDLVLGYCYYVSALTVKPESRKGMEYLIRASSHYSIHAMHTLGHLIITQKNKYADLYQDILQLIEQRSCYHATPAYLLLAKLYFFSANHSTQPSKIEDSLYLSLQYLYMAQRAEHHSEDAIHNAYLGRGLVMSNPYSLDNIPAMIEQLQKYSGLILNSTSQLRAKKQAHFDYDTAHKQFSKLPSAPQKKSKISAIFAAVIKDDTEKLRALAGDVEEINDQHETPLVLAARLGHINSVRCLLALKAEPSVCDHSKNTPLHYALLLNHLGISRLLMAHPQIDLQYKNKYKISCEGLLTHFKITKLQLEDKYLHELNENLMTAIRFKQNDEAQIYLLRGANPDITATTGEPILISSVRQNNVDMLELLLSYGANLDKPNKIGETAITIAYNMKQLSSVSLLLQAHANLNIPNLLGQTILINAVKNEDIETVTLLLSHKADPNIQDKLGHSALYYALNNKSDEIFKLLLKHKANPTQQTKLGKSIIDIINEREMSAHLALLTQSATPKLSQSKFVSTAGSLFKSERIEEIATIATPNEAVHRL